VSLANWGGGVRSHIVRRYKVLLPILIFAGMLAITACSASLPQGTSGSIALIPFWDEEQGIQGVQPPEGWSEEAMLHQLAIPASRQDALAELLAETDLSDLPESAGGFKGKAFSWDLYTFESHLEGAPVDTVHFDLAAAETGSTSYVVLLLTLPAAYDADPALYDTVFTHALYALEPME
jgi:hypothetical protein